MKILFLSQHYRPEPCDTRTSALAEGIAERGHTSSVITSFPNYPFGKVYDGYQQSICQRTMSEGVDLVRIPMIPDHSRSKKKRALSYLSFGASAFFLGGLFTKKPDMIWIHHPPLTTGIAGYLLAKVKRVPFVYEIHDLWPESLVSTGMIKEGRVTRAIRKVCNFLHKRASAIVVTSPGMKTHLERQNVDPDKIICIPQWADESAFSPVGQDLEFGLRHGLVRKKSVVFAGNIGIAQGLDTVLDAAKLLSDVSDFQFVLIGDGVESDRLKARCAEEAINNVLFTGHRPAAEVSSFMSWAEAGLIHLQKAPLFAITIPSKTQAYMACGVPILCGVEGDGADAVIQAECGYTFTPGDANDLADKVREMLSLTQERKDLLAENAFIAFQENYSKERILDRYEELFASVIGTRRAVISKLEAEIEKRAA